MLYTFLLYNTVVQLCVYIYTHTHVWGFPGGSGGKAPTCNAGDVGLIPGLGRFPWRREWQPTPVPYLGNPMDREAWQATVYGVAKELDTTKQLNNKITNNIHIYNFSFIFFSIIVSQSILNIVSLCYKNNF